MCGILLAELGTDMSRSPTDRHVACWAGMCPGNNESAGKSRVGKTRGGVPGCGTPLLKRQRQLAV
jgi:transposase